MKKNIFTCTLFLLISLCGYSQNPSGLEDRTYWITVLTKIADPVLENMSKGELKKNMPVETISGALNPPQYAYYSFRSFGTFVSWYGSLAGTWP